MNKRENLLALLDEGKCQDTIPAAFFVHFDKIYHEGQAAVDKHLEYFRFTGMDFVKIQFESTFPPRPEIQRPADWAGLPVYGTDFYQGQLDAVEGLVKAAKHEAVVIVTLYSPFMCAGHTAGSEILTTHIKESPDQVKKGMEIITESLLLFVKECIRLGVDGFYASTQGGESDRFGGSPLFDECIRPYDLAVMEEINRSCIFNILHVCDYHGGGYDDLTPFVDYPGHIVNCNLKSGSKQLTPQEVAKMFDRPFMGGLDRKGVIISGSEEEIKKTVEDTLSDAPDKFILGADCTLPGEFPWENIRTAISTAHEYRRK